MAEPYDIAERADYKFFEDVGSSVTSLVRVNMIEGLGREIADALFANHITKLRCGQLDPFLQYGREEHPAEASVLITASHMADDQKWEERRVPLSEMVVEEAKQGDYGYHVARIISALEQSIVAMRDKAATLGWNLDA